MRDPGMAGSTLGRRMRGSSAEAREQESWAVPEDYAKTIGGPLNRIAPSRSACTRCWPCWRASRTTPGSLATCRGRTVRVGAPKWVACPGVVSDVGFVSTSRGPAITCQSASKRGSDSLLMELGCCLARITEGVRHRAPNFSRLCSRAARLRRRGGHERRRERADHRALHARARAPVLGVARGPGGSIADIAGAWLICRSPVVRFA